MSVIRLRGYVNMKEMKKPVLRPERFRRDLLAWYGVHRRNLPWRRTRDPYAIWVSEIMLQQTQVARVINYWRKFTRRFPTVTSLAQASQDEVLALWSGLGYYRRARHLHAAAKMVVDQLGGKMPSAVEDLKCLPGMGEYTAAAVASIAFDRPVPVVDANVVRVLCRVLALRGDPSRGKVRQRLQEEAAKLVDPKRPGQYNQAVMELGATVCTATSPKCLICPVSEYCLALWKGRPEEYPSTIRKASVVELLECVALVQRRGKILLARQPHERGWWAGLWTLPRCPLAKDDDPVECLRRVVLERFGLTCSFEGKPREFGYGVTRHRVTMLVYWCDDADGRLKASSKGKWFGGSEMRGIGIPSPVRKVLRDGISTDETD
jgi:A/G-specific adenine glycosylase